MGPEELIEAMAIKADMRASEDSLPYLRPSFWKRLATLDILEINRGGEYLWMKYWTQSELGFAIVIFNPETRSLKRFDARNDPEQERKLLTWAADVTDGFVPDHI